MGVDIGPKIGIDGEAEFRKALQEIATQAKTLGAEMKAVTSAFDKNDKSQAALSAKAGVLTKQIQAQKDKLELQKKALEESRQKFGDADAATQKWQKIVYESTATLNKMERELAETEDGVRNVANSSAKSSDAMIKNADATSKASKQASRFGDIVGDVSKRVSGLGDIIKGELIADALKGLASAFSDAASETQEYRKIIGSLEVSSAKAGYTASETAETYRTLYGVLADDQTSATTTANLQALNVEQSKLNEIVRSAIGAWATYGDSIPIDGLAESINETIRTGKVTGTFADVLNWGSKEGETFGIMLKANTKSNKEWNDAVKSASSAEDYFNLALESAGSEADRVNLVLQAMADQGLEDAGKAWEDNNKTMIEANKSTAAQQDAIAQLGEKAEPVLTAVKNGFTSILRACNDLLSGVDFVAIADGVSSGFDYFSSNIVPMAVDALGSLASKLKSIAEEIDWGEIIESLKTSLEKIIEKAGELIDGIDFGLLSENILNAIDNVKYAADKIKSLFGFLIENGDYIASVISGIAAGFVAWNVVTMIQGVVSAIKAFQTANEGATVAQMILNAVMSANPIGIIVTAIAGLVAAIAVLWNTNEDFRKFVLEVWEGIKAAVLDAILGVLGWIQDMGNGFVELKDSFVSSAKALADGAISKFNDLKSKAVSSFNGLKTSVSTIVSGMKTAVVNTVTNIKNNAVSIFTGMKASISNTVTGIKTAVVNGFGKAVSYITSLPGKAIGWGRDFVNGLRRGIENAISGLIRSVKGIADKIRGFLHFSRPDFGPLRDYESWMPDFVGGLASGIEANAWRLEDAVERMAGRAAINMDGAPAGTGGYNLGGVSIVVNAAKGQDEEAIANKVMRKMQNLYDSKRRVYR